MLSTLKPLQLYEHPTALASEGDLNRLQEKLIELGTSAFNATAAPHHAALHSPSISATPNASATPTSTSPATLSPGVSLAARRPSASEEDVSLPRAPPDALRALLRVALVKGQLLDHLRALRTLRSIRGGACALDAPKRPMRGGLLPVACELVAGLRELEATCSTVLSQRRQGFCASSSLGQLSTHPLLGIYHSAEAPARGALLASGSIEAHAACAVLTATLSQCAASTVWGVGPWEHDFQSLITEPPPDEIASAVALAAAQASDDADTDEAPVLEMCIPLCVDVSPRTLELLLRTTTEVLDEVAVLQDVHGADSLALAYTCLGLLRLLKVHMHFICTSRIRLADLGLEMEPATATESQDESAVRDVEQPTGRVASCASSDGCVPSSTLDTAAGAAAMATSSAVAAAAVAESSTAAATGRRPYPPR